MKYQSAKVYVIDVHFDSDDMEEISKKKEELDRFFDELRIKLEAIHKGSSIDQVFLRKH